MRSGVRELRMREEAEAYGGSLITESSTTLFVVGWKLFGRGTKPFRLRYLEGRGGQCRRPFW